MAKLNAAERNRLPDSAFAGPDRTYPVKEIKDGKVVPSPSHAGNAKARASHAENAGRISKEQEARIDAKADRVLKSGHGYGR